MNMIQKNKTNGRQNVGGCARVSWDSGKGNDVTVTVTVTVMWWYLESWAATHVTLSLVGVNRTQHSGEHGAILSTRLPLQAVVLRHFFEDHVTHSLFCMCGRVRK